MIQPYILTSKSPLPVKNIPANVLPYFLAIGNSAKKQVGEPRQIISYASDAF